jgi:hypothetical protein
MLSLLDAYNLRARMFPVFLVLFPLGAAVAAWVPVDYQLLGTLGSFFVTLGFAMLLQQLARDAGKNKEDGLFTQWGGRPSVRMLYYAHSKLNRKTLARCHAKLRELAPDLKIPADIEEESKNTADALFAYESCNDLLVNRTRDKEKFGLLFEENVNYGFRRNLWGLKPYGIVTALIGTVSAGAQITQHWINAHDMSVTSIGCVAVTVFLLMLWLFAIKPEWVRSAAESYAMRLVLCCETLEAPKKTA